MQADGCAPRCCLRRGNPKNSPDSSLVFRGDTSGTNSLVSLRLLLLLSVSLPSLARVGGQLLCSLKNEIIYVSLVTFRVTTEFLACHPQNSREPVSQDTLGNLFRRHRVPPDSVPPESLQVLGSDALVILL